MKTIALLAAFLAAGCAQASAPAQNNAAIAQPPVPAAGANAEQEAIMDRIERDVRLPAGADALSAYSRSYAWQERGDDVRKVVAVFENLTGAPPGRRRWVAETQLPLVMDGGCGLISLSYDVATQRIEHISCNGVA